MFVVAVVLGCSGPAWTAEYTIRYSPEGQLLEPLPQLKRKDGVVFRIVGAEAYGASGGRVYSLRYRCGGDESPWTEVPFEAAGPDGVEAGTADACVGSRWLSWEILTSTRDEREIQRVLHPTVEAFLTIGTLADRALETGVFALSEGSWVQLSTALQHANEYGANLQLEGVYSTEVQLAVRRIVAPVGFGASSIEAPPADRATWQSLQQGAYDAFRPYREFEARRESEVAALEGSVAALEREREVAAAELALLEFGIADTVDPQALPALFAQKHGIEDRLAEQEAEIDELNESLASWQSSPPRAAYPLEWRAAGSLPMGWRERVISIDPETHRFQQNSVAIDDHDRAWLAVANVTEHWTLSKVEEEAATDGGPSTDVLLMTSRGGGEATLPDISLKDAEPAHRVVIQELGRRRGHHQVTFTVQPASGGEGVSGSYYVRRTHHVSLKQGAALSFVPNRSLEFVEDEDGQTLFEGGVPVTVANRADYEPEPLIGLAFYLHPHDLMDDLRRPPWMRALPHLFVGWAPTDIMRGYVGVGFEPFTGFSIEAGAALGASKALRPPVEGYEWTIDDVFSVGWFVALCTDVTVFEKLFGKVSQLQ